ncbi:MAG: hypothetical protein ACRDHM_07705 [Actinomycetota bacterium]
MTSAVQRNPLLVRETVGEIVGYLGAAAGLTGASIALGSSAATPSVQVVFNLVTGAVLFGAGLALGADAGVYARMRSVFWFLSVFLIAGMVALLLGPILELSPKTVVVLSSLITAAYSFGLWWMSRRSLQVLALILSLLVTLIALVFPDVSGAAFGPPSFTGVALVTWLYGGAVIAAGALGLLTPRRTTLAVGSVIAVVGPLFLLQGDTQILGELLALVTAVGLLAAGAWFGELGMTGIGIAGILVAASTIVADHVQEQGPAIAVLLIGLVMVGVAIILARTARQPPASIAATPPPPTPPASS